MFPFTYLFLNDAFLLKTQTFIDSRDRNELPKSLAWSINIIKKNMQNGKTTSRLFAMLCVCKWSCCAREFYITCRNRAGKTEIVNGTCAAHSLPFLALNLMLTGWMLWFLFLLFCFGRYDYY